jgi:hypothetical protein
MDALMKLKSEGKINGGRVPVGERALVLIFEAKSIKSWTLFCKVPLWVGKVESNSAREPRR